MAVEHLTKAGEDARAMNALGVLYYRAPDVWEDDPVKIHGFRSVRRDRTKAIDLLKKAEEKGSVQAAFNLGAVFLDETSPETFSFSKAWEKFTTAASSGQVLAQYNMGVMHF